ncbi:MAG: ATP-binding protein [Pseudonocardia sp.]
MLYGPRTVGKSTLLQRLARTLGGQVVDLDDRATRTVAAADPSICTSGDTLTLIDEYQRVPELLDSIKAELSRRLRPGRFVVTGSTNYSTIPRAAQSLTGRAEVLTVWPFTQGEIDSRHESFVEVLLTDPSRLRGQTSNTTRVDYARRVLAGGLPAALRQPSDAERRRWFQSYLDLVVRRDVLDIRNIRHGEALPQLLRTLVGQTGQLLNISNAAEAARPRLFLVLDHRASARTFLGILAPRIGELAMHPKQPQLLRLIPRRQRSRVRSHRPGRQGREDVVTGAARGLRDGRGRAGRAHVRRPARM